MSLTIEKFESDNALHLKAADNIIFCSAIVGTMQPLNNETLSDHTYGLVAYGDSVRIPGAVSGIGYIALTDYEEGRGTIGGLIVSPAYWRQGVGRLLTRRLLTTIKHQFPDLESCEAYANDESKDLFLALGAVEIGRRQPPVSTGCNYVIDFTPALTP